METFTSTNLVSHAKKALNENWGYCLGAFGNLITEAFLKQKCSQEGYVGEYNSKNKAYIQRFMGNRATDCYGLVKSFVWWNSGNVKYVASQDRNQEGAFNAAAEKGTLATLPEVPGLVLWMKGHAGVYIGRNAAGIHEFIECAGAPTGMKKGTIMNGAVTSGSKFTHWFKDSYIEYPVGQTKPAPYAQYPTLRIGSKGVYVSTLQGLLNKTISAGLPVDGDFGKLTDAAVRKLQSGKKIAADGIVGPMTWRELAQ